MTQIKLVDFQIARILSERSLKNNKQFRRLTLLAPERKMFKAYCQKDVNTLTDCELVEFQKLYCKLKIICGINDGKFEVSLNFSKELQPEVKEWLKEYGFYLTPLKKFDNTQSFFYRIIHPAEESKTKFKLRW